MCGFSCHNIFYPPLVCNMRQSVALKINWCRHMRTHTPLILVFNYCVKQPIKVLKYQYCYRQIGKRMTFSRVCSIWHRNTAIYFVVDCYFCLFLYEKRRRCNYSFALCYYSKVKNSLWNLRTSLILIFWEIHHILNFLFYKLKSTFVFF